MRIGTRVGRYLLEEELGRGGMGVVYAAHDPELDRKVAIKLLRTATAEGTEGKSRLQREAQAMAKLAHPNVIAVFDVGTSGDDVFVAMELCRGGTLRAYQRARGWRDIVLAYVQAGRGLAAAHAAGLVHRDFKPDNVLVGTDGRMRVTDFGLVRAAGPLGPGSRPAIRMPDDPAVTPSALSSELTEAGSVMGTPMYMAPEQMTGGTLGPAADQFAFATALWQGLHGEPPYLSVDLTERVAEIAEGRRRPPQNRAVPARINKALERALASAPGHRWPDLGGLLDALERGTRSRKPWIAGGIGAAALATGAVLLLARGGDPAACGAADAAGRGLWSARRSAVEQAFGKTDAPFAAAAFGFADARLAGLEAAWRQAATTACEDTRVRHTQSPLVLDQRMACLTSRRQRIAAVVEALGRADRAVVDNIDTVLGELPRLEECTDAAVLAGKAPRPADAATARRLADVERRIDVLHGKRMSRAGGAFSRAELDEMFAEAEVAVREATELGYAPVFAEALIARGTLASARGTGDDGRRDLVDAAAAATRGGDRERLATAYLDLLYLDADARADFAGAESWSQLAGAAVDALGGPPGKRADLAEFRAILAQRRGDFAAARKLLEDAVADTTLPAEEREPLKSDLALVLTDDGDYDAAEQLFAEIIPARTRELGAEHPKVLGLRHNRANLMFFRGDFGACRAEHAEILPLREQVLGPEHFAVARTLHGLAVCLNKSGRAAEALPLIQRAVTIYTAQRGADHPDTLSAKSDLGGVHNHLGDHAAALASNLEVLAARERALGPEHPDLGITLVNTAIEAKNAGRFAEALAYHQRALAIFEKALGPDHATLGFALINYGEGLRAAGKPVEAIAAFERSRKIIEAAFGGDHVILAHPWFGIGMAELQRGRARVAVTWLEQAVARRDRAGAELDRNEQAEARAGLARALVAAGGDRARARALAEQAIAAWKELGGNFDRRRQELEGWLRTVK